MRMTCTINPIGKTRPTVCPLPPYTQVELITTVKGILDGDEMLELFLTGDVKGREKEQTYIPIS